MTLSEMRRRTWVSPWLPNLVTTSRIALAPVFVVVAEATRDAEAAGIPSARLRVLTVALLVVIAASDKVDGYLARRSRRGPSRRGAILDASADRLIQWTAAWFFALRWAPAFTQLPLWFPLALAARDLTLSAVWLWLRSGRTNFEHEIHGKVATVCVFAVLIAAAAGVPLHLVIAAAAVALAVVFYSTTRYALRLRGPKTAFSALR